MGKKICFICKEPNYRKSKTCSQRCARKYAIQTIKHPRYIANKRYNTPDKLREIDFICECIKYGNFQKRILTFEGAGLFTKKCYELYNFIRTYSSLDVDKQIIQAARMENWILVHSSYKGRSSDFYKKYDASFFSLFWKFHNRPLNKFLKDSEHRKDRWNFIWLDYCGKFTKDKLEDIKLLKGRLTNSYIFFITLYRARETFFSDKDVNKTSVDLIDLFLDGVVDKELNGICFYKDKYKHMITYGFCSGDLFKDLSNMSLANKTFYKDFNSTIHFMKNNLLPIWAYPVRQGMEKHTCMSENFCSFCKNKLERKRSTKKFCNVKCRVKFSRLKK